MSTRSCGIKLTAQTTRRSSCHTRLSSKRKPCLKENSTRGRSDLFTIANSRSKCWKGTRRGSLNSLHFVRTRVSPWSVTKFQKSSKTTKFWPNFSIKLAPQKSFSYPNICQAILALMIWLTKTSTSTSLRLKRGLRSRNYSQIWAKIWPLTFLSSNTGPKNSSTLSET